MVSVTYKSMPDRVLLLEIAINSHELLKELDILYQVVGMLSFNNYSLILDYEY